MRVCPVCGVTSQLTNRHCPECGTRLDIPNANSAALNRATVEPAPAIRPNGALNELLEQGTVLNGRYRVSRILGTGAFGRVYLAQDSDEPNQLLAIKELLISDFPSSEEQRDASNWFKREVSALLTLDHPGIPTIHGYWTANRMTGPMYLAMDYIPGKTLADIQASSGGRVSRQEAVGWTIGLCEVLTYLHSRTPPFVFRDLKPANVMIHGNSGRPILIDFGLARQIVAVGGTAVGTWGYVPFEQVLGKAEAGSDLYALGAMLHSLLSSRQPDVEYRRALRSGLDLEGALRSLFPPLEILMPGTPSALSQAVARATAFDLKDRFRNADEMAAALRKALTAQGGIVALGPVGASGRAASSDPASVSIETRAAEVDLPAPSNNGSDELEAPKLLPNASADLLPVMERLEEDRPTSKRVRAYTPAGGTSQPASSQANAVATAPSAKEEVDGRRGRWRTRKSKEKERREVPPAETLVVSASGDGQFTSIRDALQQARPGARIEVFPGTYAEGFIIDRAVEIVGVGAVDDIVIESATNSCVVMQTEAAIIRNLTVSSMPSASGERFYGVNVPTGRLLIEDCTIISRSLACVAIHGVGTSPILRRCLLRNTMERAVAVYDHARGLVEECEIVGSTMPVRVSSHADPVFRRCLIHGGKFGGVGIAEQGRGRFEDCDIVDNGHHGVAVRQASTVGLYHCRINRNGWNAISVADNSGARVDHCDLTANRRTTWDIKESARPLVRNIDNLEG